MKLVKKRLTVKEKQDRLNQQEERLAIIEDKSVYKTIQSKMNYDKFDYDKDEELTKRKFLELLNNEFDLSILDEEGNIEFINKITAKRKQANAEFYKFNLFIKKLHKDSIVDLVDSMKYMVEEFLDTKSEILYCLNEDNLYELRKILAKRYRIKDAFSGANLFWYLGEE